MSSFKHPIIGQEAVIPEFGLGEVISFKDTVLDRYIEVEPYIKGYPMKFSPENVKLVKIFYEEGGE